LEKTVINYLFTYDSYGPVQVIDFIGVNVLLDYDPVKTSSSGTTDAMESRERARERERGDV
jgi:hypothetical protein